MNPVATAIPWVVPVLGALALAACSKAPPTAPSMPPMEPPQNMPQPATAGTSNTTVPEASVALAPASASQTASSAGRTNGNLTRTQESVAMPLPGQANDHSAPLTPAKPASSP